MNATQGSTAISKLMDVQEYCNHIASMYVEETTAYSIAVDILDIIKEKR